MSVEGGPCVPRLLQWWRGQADRQEIRLYKARYQNINILQASFFFWLQNFSKNIQIKTE